MTMAVNVSPLNCRFLGDRSTRRSSEMIVGPFLGSECASRERLVAFKPTIGLKGVCPPYGELLWSVVAQHEIE